MIEDINTLNSLQRKKYFSHWAGRTEGTIEEHAEVLQLPPSVIHETLRLFFSLKIVANKMLPYTNKPLSLSQTANYDCIQITKL
jgi:hypothetical protein